LNIKKLLLTILILSLPCLASAKKAISNSLVKGKKHGRWIEYSGGKKWREVEYNNGMKSGKWTAWYENGNKEYEKIYNDNMLNGQSIDWYKNGNKKNDIEYKDGKENGLWIHWSENGKLERKELYKDGVLIKKLLTPRERVVLLAALGFVIVIPSLFMFHGISMWRKSYYIKNTFRKTNAVIIESNIQKCPSPGRKQDL